MNEDWYCEFAEDEVGNPQVWFGIDLNPFGLQNGYEKLAELVMTAIHVLNDHLLDDSQLY